MNFVTRKKDRAPVHDHNRNVGIAVKHIQPFTLKG
ncbi:Uncharacterised protein [Vibrio cholerae]|nr:Uncharacterised protein [Vibrio cholerae]